MADSTSTKVALPNFLKMLTNNNVSATKAMAIAGKLYKTYNTFAALAGLTDFKLEDAGISSAEDRKQILAAVRKAGYKPKQTVPQRNTPANAIPGTSKLASSDVSASPKQLPAGTHTDPGKVRKKRKRETERNEFLPDRSSDELEEQAYGSLEFNEVLDVTVLSSKFAVINRAPIMSAWSFIVAERLGFTRQEALSIASVYTEMNAISKGVSIGIYAEGKQKGVEATKGGSQPYVDLMGRRPLFQTAKSSWRALSSGTPASPASAFSYISRSLRQTAPYVVGALRLLAETYTPEELNKHGFALYAEFRPAVDEWGGRGEVRCEKILNLRKGKSAGLLVQSSHAHPSTSDTTVETSVRSGSDAVVKFEQDAQQAEESLESKEGDEGEESGKKKSKTMSLEEYEAALDEDDTFAHIDLDFGNLGDGT